MWRCFLRFQHTAVSAGVCSTHVEMFQLCRLFLRICRGLLHACGDVSRPVQFVQAFRRFAPRMWRCFFHLSSFSPLEKVCSTHVEMFPPSHEPISFPSSLLHACGDVSATRPSGPHYDEFAPRMWRCFRATRGQDRGIQVCSTHVEMFLMMSRSFRACVSLLHACGDVSCKDHLD